MIILALYDCFSSFWTHQHEHTFVKAIGVCEVEGERKRQPERPGGVTEDPRHFAGRLAVTPSLVEERVQALVATGSGAYLDEPVTAEGLAEGHRLVVVHETLRVDQTGLGGVVLDLLAQVADVRREPDGAHGTVQVALEHRLADAVQVHDAIGVDGDRRPLGHPAVQTALGVRLDDGDALPERRALVVRHRAAGLVADGRRGARHVGRRRHGRRARRGRRRRHGAQDTLPLRRRRRARGHVGGAGRGSADGDGDGHGHELALAVEHDVHSDREGWTCRSWGGDGGLFLFLLS